MNKNNDSLLFLSGILVGAVVGGVTALLVAPQSGDVTREKIAKTSKKVLKDAQKEAKILQKRLEPKFNELKEVAKDKFEEARSGFEKGVKSVKS